ncbi:MAG: DegT/DnrJ/EryC1/StrS family aminotransferase, partial [Ferruginibacter sp.]
ELQAAMGLAILPYMDHILEERKKVVAFYNGQLDFSRLQNLTIRPFTEWNYSYYSVIFHSEDSLLKTVAALIEKNICPRRYFYPSLNTIEYTGGKHMPISESIAKRILCLPLYASLHDDDLSLICQIINSNV